MLLYQGIYQKKKVKKHSMWIKLMSSDNHYIPCHFTAMACSTSCNVRSSNQFCSSQTRFCYQNIVDLKTLRHVINMLHFVHYWHHMGIWLFVYAFPVTLTSTKFCSPNIFVALAAISSLLPPAMNLACVSRVLKVVGNFFLGQSLPEVSKQLIHEGHHIIT